MKTLIIGYGSIGKRHARLLKARGAQLIVVTSQDCEEEHYASLPEALAKSTPDYVVICSATARHAQDLQALVAAGYRGRVLVEKPIYQSASDIVNDYPFALGVAYQLRFHPGIVKLREAIGSQKVLSAHMYVGQHLSQWRPGREVKETYSAHKAQGGGVVRDLSHELDLAHYLFGRITKSHGLAARTADVTVDSEDVAVFALQTEAATLVTVQMNYLDHIARREIVALTPAHSYKLDFIAKTLEIDGKTERFNAEADTAYIAMHKAMLEQNGQGVCSLQEALALTHLIDTVAPYA